MEIDWDMIQAVGREIVSTALVIGTEDALKLEIIKDKGGVKAGEPGMKITY